MKTINLKLRHQRRVIKELAVSLEEFKVMMEPSKGSLQDLEQGYKAQGYIVCDGLRITYVATKY